MTAIKMHRCIPSCIQQFVNLSPVETRSMCCMEDMLIQLRDIPPTWRIDWLCFASHNKQRLCLVFVTYLCCAFIV
jgi:hypothetical protein